MRQRAHAAASVVAADRRRLRLLPAVPFAAKPLVTVRTNSLFKWLALMAVAASGGIAVFLLVDAKQRGELWLELDRGLIQLVVVVVFGAALKLVADRYQERQQRAEQNHLFRQDKYDRLVQATNELRRVPILIDANRSVKTWSDQMLAVINTGLTLRMIKHQIYSSRRLKEPPFPNYKELVYLFELMYDYTDWVTADFADRKKQLSEVQRQAEKSDLPGEERADRQDALWNGIRELRSVADMLRSISRVEREQISREERQSTRAAIEQKLKALAGAENGAAPPMAEARSWVIYEEAESLALESMTGL